MNADKYKWHDLRQDPNDLPEENNYILVTDGNRFYMGQVFRRFAGLVIKTELYRPHNYEISEEEYINNSDIIAWKYEDIEPCEVEE